MKSESSALFENELREFYSCPWRRTYLTMSLPPQEIERMYRNYNRALDYWQETLLTKCFQAWKRSTTISANPSNAATRNVKVHKHVPNVSETSSPSGKSRPSRLPLSQLSRLASEDSSGVNNVFQTIQNVRANRLKLRSAAVCLNEGYPYDRQNLRKKRNLLSLTNRNNNNTCSIELQTQVRNVP